MDRWLVAHVASTAAYAGFQATIQVLVYPQMARVPAAAFAGYEAAHQSRVSLLVGPLFAGLLVTTTALVLRRPAGVPLTAVVVSALLVGAVLVLTAVGAVPLHGRLTQGFDAAAHRALLRVDLARTLAALAAALLACWVLVRAGRPG